VPNDHAPHPVDPSQYIPDVSPVSGVPSQGTYFLGRYRIIDEIGLGGMASVHLARVDGLGGFQRWFAIKRIHSHLVEDETFVNMFLDEANVAARISHPNVATVFELGRHDDTYWIAMEYLHGEPLREVMRRTEEMGTTMPPEIACRVIAEAADGLHAAHELQGKDGEKLNLIHRDVTPHNLFVTYEGVTKVVDFGIAKFQDRMASTQAGTLKGKLAYMSPEQVQGESIDRRTDIFALGVVLWELTTGQRLFRMDSDLDTLAKVQECNIPPPSTMVRGYPLDLEKILMQALAKKREDRFQTAREFSRALQSLLTRRGLFIASDEVAAYMSSIFVDRIAKREEHLRWASAVSDAAAARAASAPPPAQAPPVARVPAAAKSSGPAPLPAVSGAPRPAAGAPARPPTQAPPPSISGANRNGLQRPSTQPYSSPGAVARPSAPQPQQRGGMSYPLPQPTSASGGGHDDDDEDRTVQATAAQQAAAQAGYADDYDDDGDATIVSRAPSSDEGPPSLTARPQQRPVIPAAGMPAAGAPPPGAVDRGPLPAFGSGPPPPPTRPPPPMAGNRTMPLNAVPQMGAPMRTQPPLGLQRTQLGGGQAPAAPPPPALGYQDRVPQSISDPALPQTLGGPPLPAGAGWGAQPGAPAYGAPQGAPAYGAPPFGAPPSPNPTMPSFGQGSPFEPAPFPGQPPFGAAAGTAFPAPAQPVRSDPRAATGQFLRPKRVPAWAVAVASGLVALVFAGGLVLIYALVSSPRKPDGQPVAAGSGSVKPGSSAAPGSGARGGAFAAARSGFLAAAIPPPVTLAPAPEPVAPVAAATAPDTAAPAPVAPDPTPVAAAPPAPSPPPAPPPQQVAAVTPTPTRNYDPPPAAAPTPTPQPRVQPAASPTPVAGTGGSTGGAGLPRGYVSVICLPGCDRVEIDGQSLGASPIFRHAATVGSHRIKLISSNPPGTKVVSKIVVADTVAMVRESMP
jgi:serine/threonine-protein kinase